MKRGNPGGLKYFNVIGKYIPFLRRCVEHRLWILQQGTLWGAYDWAFNFGITWMGNNFDPQLIDPHRRLSDGLAVIEQRRAAGLPSAQIEVMEQQAATFGAAIDAYYASDKDEKLLESMRSGVWVF